MKCPVPVLVERCKEDLRRLQTSSNVHHINNRMTIICAISSLCKMEGSQCPGVENCAQVAQNTEVVLGVWDWIADQFRRSLCKR